MLAVDIADDDPLSKQFAAAMNWQLNQHRKSEKNGPYSFQHNFRQYCPFLIIFSLLLTEINCDQV